MWGCLGRARKAGREGIDGTKQDVEHYWLSKHNPATHSRAWEVCCVSSCGRGEECVIGE